jgi:hypothetical protein
MVQAVKKYTRFYLNLPKHKTRIYLKISQPVTLCWSASQRAGFEPWSGFEYILLKSIQKFSQRMTSANDTVLHHM